MYHTRTRILALSLIIVTLFSVVPPKTVRSQGEGSPSWCVSVWYPSSEDATGYDSLINNLDAIHEVNPFWYGPALDGTIFKFPNSEDPEKLKQWRDAGLAILPTIATTGASAMIEDEAIRAEHIAAIVALVETNDYDGIDIDYEGYALATREPFSIFMEELATALHANNRILSMAVHAKTDDVAQWDAATAQDWPRLTATVDIFRIMTYDYHNRASTAGPIGPLPWVEQVLDYAASVTDLAKVRLGLHFYGYSWRRGNIVATITWVTVQRWMESFELAYTRDETDMEANLELVARGLPKQTIYIADSIGLNYKLENVREKYPTLGGVAIWGLGGEDPANWDVLRSIDQDCSFFAERNPLENQ